MSNKGVFGTFSVEEWYEHIKDLTFETYFIPMTVSDALSIQHSYESKKKNDVKKFTDNDKANIKNLIEKINTIIQDKFKGEPAFIRMSTRSGKDAVVKTKEFKEKLKDNLKKSGESHSVISTLSECLLIKNGEEGLNILENSERYLYNFDSEFTQIL